MDFPAPKRHRTRRTPGGRTGGGFTLVELMVTVAVMAVLAAILGAIYVAKLPEMRLHSAAKALAGDLRLARSLAVANDRPYFVCFSGTGAYQIDRVEDPPGATDCGSAATPTELSDDLSAQYPGVVFGYAPGATDCPSGGGAVADAVVFTSDRAVFNAQGASMTGSGSGAAVQGTGLIYLTSAQTAPQQTYCIRVQGAVGNIRTLKWNPASSTWEA